MKKIQGLGLSTRPQISIPLTVSGMGPNPQTAGIWGRGGAASRTRASERPAPAPRTRSGHSRFLHRLPPLATGVGDVGTAAVHGAQLPAAPPRAVRACLRDLDAAGTTAAAGAYFHEAAPASPASSPGGGKSPRPPSLGSHSPARPGELPEPGAGGGDRRRPVSEAGQVPSIPAEAVRCGAARR